MKAHDLREAICDGTTSASSQDDRSSRRSSFQHRLKNFTNQLDDTSADPQARAATSRASNTVLQRRERLRRSADQGGRRPKEPRAKSSSRDRSKSTASRRSAGARLTAPPQAHRRRHERQDEQDGRRRWSRAALAHKMYGKYVTRRTKYKAHDEKNEYKVGDRVEIVEQPPALARQALARGTPHRAAAGGVGAAMIQMQHSTLDVADNSGAKQVSASRCSAARAAATPSLGDVIVVVDQRGAPGRQGEEGRRRARPSSSARRREVVAPTAATSGSTTNSAVLINKEQRADRHPHLRAGRSRAPREEVHEDHLARAGGAVMARASQGRQRRRHHRQGQGQARQGAAPPHGEGPRGRRGREPRQAPHEAHAAQPARRHHREGGGRSTPRTSRSGATSASAPRARASRGRGRAQEARLHEVRHRDRDGIAQDGETVGKSG